MQDFKNYLSSIGRRGGKSKSPAKIKAMRSNLKKAWSARRKVKRKTA